LQLRYWCCYSQDVKLDLCPLLRPPKNIAQCEWKPHGSQGDRQQEQLWNRPQGLKIPAWKKTATDMVLYLPHLMVYTEVLLPLTFKEGTLPTGNLLWVGRGARPACIIYKHFGTSAIPWWFTVFDFSLGQRSAL
jgi:hypothetical protein